MSAIPAPQCVSPRSLVRSYNLMAISILGLAGIAFGSVLFAEDGAADSIDDAGLLLVGIAAVIWYLSGKNRFRLSLTPIWLTTAALLFQITGIILEAGDTADRGDNLGGLVLYVPLLIFLGVQFRKTRRTIVEAPRQRNEPEYPHV
jgi:hypothetical protein